MFLVSPGHARHLYCVFDVCSQGIFSGDTFGLSYREFDTDRGPFIFPATAPVQFEPDELHASIDQLLQYHPISIYLTHFGRVMDVPRLADDLHHCIDQLVALARSITTSGPERHHELMGQIEQLLLTRLQAHGCTMDREQMLALFRPDLDLDVWGLEVWLDRVQKHKEKRL